MRLLTNPLIFLALFCLSLQVGKALALEASLDRNRMTINETIRLTIQGPINPSDSLSLFNLNTLDIESPDLGPLERDFDILDRQQRYELRLINGENQSVVTWQYTLQPKRIGQMTIPSFSLNGARTDPIALEVMASPAEGISRGRDVVIEAEFDEPSVLVDEQVILTVRILYRGDLINGELDHPEHPRALFFQLGDQREYAKFAFGRHYKAVERRYAVFAKQAGVLELPTLNFTGRFISSQGSRHEMRRASSPSLSLQVREPPADFSGPTWLPAQGLSLQQDWSSDLLELDPGDSISRTIRIQALAQDAANLPPLPVPNLPGLKIYTEPAELQTDPETAGLTGNRREVWTLIATEPGLYTLPELTVQWWDTFSQRQREARLPARSIRVRAAAGLPMTTPAELAGMADSPAGASVVAESEQSARWPLLILLLIAALLALLLFRERRLRRYWQGHAQAQSGLAVFSGDADPEYWITSLEQALREDPRALPALLPGWLRKVRQHANLPEAILQRIERCSQDARCKSEQGRYTAGNNDEAAVLYPARLREINEQLIVDLKTCWPPAAADRQESDVDHLYQYGFDQEAQHPEPEGRK